MNSLPKLKSLFAAGALLGSCGSFLNAQEVFSQIVGAISIDLPAESDVIVSFPFKQSADYRGVIDSVSDDGSVHLSVAADSLTASSFDAVGGNPTHYVVFESGAQQGVHVDISSNTTSQVTLDGGSSAGLQAGDAIAVYPHWTLDSAFPDGVANHVETQPGLRELEVVIPEAVSEEGSLTPEGIYYFYNGAWRLFNGGLDSDAGATVLSPWRAMVIRNNSSEEKKALLYGEVIDAPIAIPLSESDVFTADNFVGLNRPLDIALDDLGLATGGVFEATTDPAAPKDLLIVYSGGEGKNKHLSPLAQYYYYEGAWREKEAGENVDRGTDVVSPGMGVAIRKSKVDSNPETGNWVNEWEVP